MSRLFFLRWQELTRVPRQNYGPIMAWHGAIILSYDIAPFTLLYGEFATNSVYLHDYSPLLVRLNLSGVL